MKIVIVFLENIEIVATLCVSNNFSNRNFEDCKRLYKITHDEIRNCEIPNSTRGINLIDIFHLYYRVLHL